MKKNILFVGSFKEKSKDGSLGGQMFACNTLIKSNLSEYVNWVLVDSTADSNILGPIWLRALKAIKRNILFSYYLLFKNIKIVLIFTSDGLSFYEKGFMALLVKVFTNKKVILAPRSGIVIEDINRKSLLSWFIPFVVRKCDFIICQSEIWKKYYKELSKDKNEAKFVVIDNWINEKAYENFLISRNNKIPTLLFMSWVDRNKGIFELIEVAKKLINEKIVFKLIIAGKGLHFNEVQNIVLENNIFDTIELKGWVNGQEKLELLKNSNIYILPSYYEGYPNSLLEAMASGLACIATNVGSIPDFINNNENGLLINRKDKDELYEVLKKLILDEDLQLKLANNARNTILNNNTLEIGVLKYKNLFESCVE